MITVILITSVIFVTAVYDQFVFIGIVTTCAIVTVGLTTTQTNNTTGNTVAVIAVIAAIVITVTLPLVFE